ncbi:MAG TPA: MBL fold metallo-hydrolase [Spirochaetia bacterium]|nr:MBL fold metallo-hydrolase [Spirochaetales bacterium]HRY72599.1 MBL fold metallo-hydrolase [Spirochaetia bacterium]
MLSLTIWGDRGSMPTPGPDTVVFGGNTSCLEIRAGSRLVIVDAGSGIRQLGDKLMREDLKKGPIDTDIFITHTHWDHIMGFPMFTPIYVPGTRLRIHGPITYEDDTLEQVLGSQLSYRYWPVRQEELAAKIEYEQIKETTIDLGEGLTVRTKYLNHPILCLGYRFEYEGKSIVTAYDNEPFRNVFPTDPADPRYDEEAAREGDAAAAEENEKLLRFYRGADILVHDTQYTAKEYVAGKIGWGHSSYEFAVNAAHKTGVKKLLLFHHDPNRSDAELQELELFYQERLRGRTGLQAEMAREGKTYQA